MTASVSTTNAHMAPAAARSTAGSWRLAINLLIWAGSALVAGSAVIHFYLWNSHGYKNIPTIGLLFLLQAISGVALALATALWRKLLLVVAATAFLVSSAAGLLVSIWWGLFGWQESASAPYVGMALWVEAAGAVLLGTVTLALGLPWLSSRRANKSQKA